MSTAEVPVSATVIPMLLEVLEDPWTSSERVAEVVALDAGLTARVLAVANSASFGRPRQVTAIPAAVGLIGVNMVQTLAIAGSSRLLDRAGGLAHMRSHAIETACAARSIAARIDLPEADAFAAGLLHDIGELLLWLTDPSRYADAHAGWDDIETQLKAERRMFGADHATAARLKLTEWGFPGAIIDAVGDHHRPDLHHHDLSTLVAAADDLVAIHEPTGDRDRLGLGEAVLAEIRAELDEHTMEMDSLLRS